MRFKLNRKRFRGYGGNLGVVLLAAGMLDGLLKDNLAQGTILALAGAALIVLASLEKGE